ncbi:hypothetical protein ABIA39_000565 [Nocardia sp. GAS34]
MPITHPARKQALTDLCSRFEWAADSDVASAATEQIAAEQAAATRGMGW